MSEATEVPMICYDCGGTLTDDDAIWSWSPSFASHINYSQCIASLNERITAATQRVESAEAENERLRKAWQSADTTAQALSMNAGYIDVDGLRVGVHMVRSWLERMKVIDTENDLLQAERDALRKDAARLCGALAGSWLYGDWKAETLNEREQEAVMRRLGWWPITEADLIAKRDAAMAVQHTTTSTETTT